MKRSVEMPRMGAGAWTTALACLTLLLLAVGLSGCAGVTGSGKLVTTQVRVADFTKVKAADSWTVRIARGDTRSVKVTTDDNLVDRLDVVVDGGTLVLRLKPGVSIGGATLRATIVMPTLAGLDLADASNASVTGFTHDGPLALSLRDSGSAALTGLRVTTLVAQAADSSSISGSVQADQASLSLSDASDAKLSGAARLLTLRASDGSSADLSRLQAADVGATLADGSNATVAATGTLDAHVSDGSDLNYVGSPKLGSIVTSDGSSLTQTGAQAQ